MRLKLLAPVLLFEVTGCASLTHYNRERDITASSASAGAVFLDAKQRAVTFVAHDDSSPRTNLRVCAEPSPDALSALAASGSGKAAIKDYFNVAASATLAETASSIGLRTQSITLMRDVLFRLCEDYQSGALSRSALETLQRRYQSSLVAILAIEQLTGVVRPAPVLLSTGGGTGASAAIAKLSDDTVAARAANDAAQTKAKSTAANKAKADQDLAALAADAKPEDRKAAEDAAATEKTKDDDAKLAAKRTADDLDSRRKALDAIGGGDTNATATAAIGITPAPTEVSDKQAVANAVQAIVRETLDLGFLREVCATLYVSEIEGGRPENVAAISKTRTNLSESGLQGQCDRYSAATVVALEKDNERVAELLLISRSDRAAGRTTSPLLVAAISSPSAVAPTFLEFKVKLDTLLPSLPSTLPKATKHKEK